MENYSKVREHLDYPKLTMFQMVERMAAAYPNYPAYEFYGKKTTYRQFVSRIERAARAFRASGIRRGDAVTICMPNTPQALDCFYCISLRKDLIISMVLRWIMNYIIQVYSILIR